MTAQDSREIQLVRSEAKLYMWWCGGVVVCDVMIVKRELSATDEIIETQNSS